MNPHVLHLLRRRSAVGGLVAAACLVPAGSALAYSPGSQGDVGVAASYVMSESTFDAIPGQSAGDHTFSDRDTNTGTTSAATTGPGWGAFPEPVVDTACVGGCADADSVVAGRVDLPSGTLETYGRAYGWAYGQGHEALGDGTAAAYVDDTITVSHDTVVTLKGHISGHLRRTASDDGQMRPTSRLELTIGTDWCGSEGCDFPVSEDIQPDVGQTLDVDKDFEVQVPLAAGEHPFNARLRSLISAAATGTGGGVGNETTAQSDVHSGDGGTQKVTFQIVAPDDVSISSGSGHLPIVGGQPSTPSDTTPPVIQASDVIVNATSPQGAKVGYQVQVSDTADPSPSLSCSPASGAQFAIGDTTVHCTATDASGNTATKTFTVKVRGADAQLGDLLTKIGGLAKTAQAQLQPHAKLTCQGMQQVVQHTGILLKQGKITAADAADLTRLAKGISATLGC